MDKLNKKLEALKAKQAAIQAQIEQQEAEQNKVVSNVFLRVLAESTSAYRSTTNSKPVKDLNGRSLSAFEAWLAKIPAHAQQNSNDTGPQANSSTETESQSTY